MDRREPEGLGLSGLHSVRSVLCYLYSRIYRTVQSTLYRIDLQIERVCE